MNTFIGTTISTSRFTFSPKSGEFVTEASDLHGIPTFMSQLYADSGEIGFRMENHQTGRSVDFVISDERRNAEQELQYWEFKPSAADLAFDRNLADIRVVIFND